MLHRWMFLVSVFFQKYRLSIFLLLSPFYFSLDVLLTSLVLQLEELNTDVRCTESHGSHRTGCSFAWGIVTCYQQCTHTYWTWVLKLSPWFTYFKEKQTLSHWSLFQDICNINRYKKKIICCHLWKQNKNIHILLIEYFPSNEIALPIFIFHPGPANVSFVSQSFSTFFRSNFLFPPPSPIFFPILHFKCQRSSSSSSERLAIVACARKSGIILHLSCTVYKSSHSREHCSFWWIGRREHWAPGRAAPVRVAHTDGPSVLTGCEIVTTCYVLFSRTGTHIRIFFFSGGFTN